MTEPFDVGSGAWWRFSRYELRDGRIGPSPGARLEEFDPWAAFRRARSASKREDPPYRSLLVLAQELKLSPSGQVRIGAIPLPPDGQMSGFAVEPALTLTPESETKLLAWCSEYGLLGVLPHRSQMVALAPRWMPIALLPRGVAPVASVPTKFPITRFPVAGPVPGGSPTMRTPMWLSEMTLRSPGVSPPIMLSEALTTSTPSPLPRPCVPETSTPMKLPDRRWSVTK